MVLTKFLALNFPNQNKQFLNLYQVCASSNALYSLGYQLNFRSYTSKHVINMVLVILLMLSGVQAQRSRSASSVESALSIELPLSIKSFVRDVSDKLISLDGGVGPVAGLLNAFPIPSPEPHGAFPISEPLKNEIPLTLAFIGIGLYSILACFTLFSIIFPPQRVAPTRQTLVVQRIFSCMVILFCTLRVAWFCFPVAHVANSLAYGLNQFCFTIFFTMYSLITFFWAEQYHRKFYDTKSVLPRMRNTFIVCNIALWIYEIILTSLTIKYDQTPVRGNDGGPLYQASVITIIVLDFALALGFAVYGVGLLYQKYRNSTAGASLRSELIQTTFLTVALSASFFLRVVLFCYRPITGKLFNPFVFRVFGYFVPETVAVVLQVSIVYLLKQKTWWKPGQTQEDDIYAADQDLQASSMPAPIAAAHERLISAPRPSRNSYIPNNMSMSPHSGFSPQSFSPNSPSAIRASILVDAIAGTSSLNTQHNTSIQSQSSLISLDP